MPVRPRVASRVTPRGTSVQAIVVMLAALAGSAVSAAVFSTAIFFGTAFFVTAVGADVRYTKEASDAFQRKLITIVQQGNALQSVGPSGTVRAGGTPGSAPATGTPPGTPPGTPSPGTGARTTAKRPLQTSLSESELNSYLRYEIRSQIPAGVAEPTITIVGDGRLAATAVVDLDAVKAARQSTSWFDPVRLLGGKVPITASGVLQTQQGTGRFLLESADISGIPVPKAVLQQVVGYYSRSAQNPSGVNLDDAFELPARIREIHVQPGQAIVVQ